MAESNYVIIEDPTSLIREYVLGLLSERKGTKMGHRQFDEELINTLIEHCTHFYKHRSDLRTPVLFERAYTKFVLSKLRKAEEADCEDFVLVFMEDAEEEADN